jgi:putative tricarboxylic transport membrane protein
MDLINIFWVWVGAAIGLVMGALPGLTVTMTVVLVVSLTFGWDMMQALAFILGAFTGAVTGGSLSAITMNIPGTAAAVATTFDGYPMHRRGETTTAISTAFFVSLIGGVGGSLVLALLAPILGGVALKFGSQEYFLITLWGLTLVSVLSKGAFFKGMIAACIGLFIGMIGMDPITGLMRFTFDAPLLSGGVNFVVAMIGLFGMKEVFVQLGSKTGFHAEVASYKLTALLPKWSNIKKVAKVMCWSGPIGFIIGLLPGTGGDIGALTAYGVTKQVLKNPSRPLGTGAIEGVGASETANNAAIGGAVATMLTLGIPGDSVTAVIMGSFYLHGLLPGPTFQINHPQYFYPIVGFIIIGQIAACVLGVLGANLMLRMLRFPRWFLIPFIAVLCIIGTYALQNNISDVLFMVCFGLMGYIFERANYPVAPIILAIILGPIMETSLRQGLINTGSVQAFAFSLVSRPISLTCLVLIIISFVLQARLSKIELPTTQAGEKKDQ